MQWVRWWVCSYLEHCTFPRIYLSRHLYIYIIYISIYGFVASYLSMTWANPASVWLRWLQVPGVVWMMPALWSACSGIFGGQRFLAAGIRRRTTWFCRLWWPKTRDRSGFDLWRLRLWGTRHRSRSILHRCTPAGIGSGWSRDGFASVSNFHLSKMFSVCFPPLQVKLLDDFLRLLVDKVDIVFWLHWVRVESVDHMFRLSWVRDRVIWKNYPIESSQRWVSLF